ncbi:MAG: DNA-3-methyladenine glycosylase I [Candidatus Thiodiazotropha sp. (ex Ctena orbiculata)]|nr:DNA-3-methyladenine glycosylase I [Candidatus Thiodiazotropha taylori]MBT2995248.1 DNA-3-methyladenine glycosylase I [Candidatus Thiodiazotropha taylori]MBV2105732.1 DNA-3-methyladenine glycosylase I [Candidatus Thiodiazotropha taylori]MBV2109521.1 DNA-3-methyladenine glycosylase I [Candidatus Thiodiazotropha taylori]
MSKMEPCPWCLASEDYIDYHDNEWGVPSYDPQHLFEMLILEGAQAGLSWLTILRKREGYRRAFHGFDLERIAAYDDSDVKRLLADEGIVRNRLKVAAAIDNARAALVMESGEGLGELLWSFVEGKPVQNRWRSLEEVPASTHLSDRMSRELKRRGFRFVGTTICYAFMQSVGMVNDHMLSCPRHQEVAER